MPRSVEEVAAALGVSPQRVRELLKTGRLRGRKIAGRWLIEPLADPPRRSGRPMSARIAWAALAILAGERPDWISAPERSRLRRRIADAGIVDAMRTAEPRSTRYALRVHPRDRDRLLESAPLVRTGLAAGLPTLDAPAVPEILDAYVTAATADTIRRTLRALPDPDEANLLLRVPTHPWVLHRSVAPIAVVAADLLDDADPRVARAAREIFTELRA